MGIGWKKSCFILLIMSFSMPGVIDFGWKARCLGSKMASYYIPIIGDIFIGQPPLEITVFRGQTVWLKWIVDWASYIRDYNCYFIDRESGIKREIASGRPLKANPSFPKVLAFDNFTFAISNVDYNDTGVYYCKATVDGGYFGAEDTSRNTSISVEGIPQFCGGKPRLMQHKLEGESAVFNLDIYAVPAPNITYRWLGNEVNNVTTLPVNGSFYRYTSTFEIHSLTRDSCGRNLTYCAKNQLGYAMGPGIKIFVHFKPEKPQNVTASYHGREVIVRWKSQESGLCKIYYSVEFLNSRGGIVGVRDGRGITSARIDNVTTDQVTSLNVSALTSEGTDFQYYVLKFEKNIDGNEHQTHFSTGQKISAGIICGSVIGIIIFISTIALGLYCVRKKRRGNNGNYPSSDELFYEDQYHNKGAFCCRKFIPYLRIRNRFLPVKFQNSEQLVSTIDLDQIAQAEEF